jgi:hypothetical protein
MDNKFLTFIKPYLSLIDNGHFYRKPFSWLYSILAILNLILPLFVLYIAVDNDIFSGQTDIIIWFLLVWIIITFASWVSFQLWWDRKSKVNDTSVEGDKFVATAVFSHLIQTTGEWLGTWICIVGFGTALLTTIILGDERGYLLSEVGLDFLKTSRLGIVLMPIYGFLIIVATKFLAEQFKALTSIANNTSKKITNNNNPSF